MNEVVINLTLFALVIVPVGLLMVLLADAIDRHKYNKNNKNNKQ